MECCAIDTTADYDIEAETVNICDILDVCDDVEYTVRAVRNIVKESLGRKEGLRNILRVDANWNEERQAVILPADSVKADNAEFDRDYRDLNNVLEAAFKFRRNNLDNDHYEAIREVLSYNRRLMQGDEELSFLEKYNLKPPQNGQKASRLVNKILRHAHYDKDNAEAYKNIFPLVADLLNIEKQNVDIVLSINPYDYLTMSHYHRNSWKSCHDIESGSYRAGVIDLMLDKTTMVLYTCKDFFNNHYPKMLTRALMSYENGILLQGRIYPDRENYQEKTAAYYRLIVGKIISNGLGVTNFWRAPQKAILNNKMICSHKDSLHYPDYLHFNNCCITTHKTLFNEEGVINIGSAPLCLNCEDTVTNTESLTCCGCNGSLKCCKCDCDLEDDRGNFINGSLYCSNCSYCCDDCDNWFVGNGTEVYRGTGNSICVCPKCADNHYLCDKCAQLFSGDLTINYIDEYGINECVCTECWEEISINYEECGICHEYRHLGQLTEVGFVDICPDCLSNEIANRNIALCSHCKQYFSTEGVIADLCPDCFDRHRKEVCHE